MRSKIALLATGGTIASMHSKDGLIPALRAEEILRFMPQLLELYDISSIDVFSLDSSNIQPEEWITLAAKAKEVSQSVDGIVITHGTDTMAYTASALSFMLQGLNIPVVFTGSQLPLNFPYSDAPLNLEEAFSAAVNAAAGVYIVFHNKIIFGTRAVKMRTLSFDAFDSINAPPVGYFDAEGIHLSEFPPSPTLSLPKDTMLNINSKVFLLKLMPGTDIEIFNHIKNAGYKGLVLEAFGLGGLHYIRRNLIDALKDLSDSGIITLVTTQCIYEKSDFSVYEVGHGILNSKNIYGAHDMTTEAAVTKLMWILGDKEKRLPYINLSLSHEMI
ncbi:MAG: asparaginase [Christensenellales bacterium]|jgi:L-asparaginase|nr:asparaginase [Christensenellaceae bacterium]